MADGSSSLDPSLPTKVGAEAWMLFCCPVPAGRRISSRVIMMWILSGQLGRTATFSHSLSESWPFMDQ